MIYGGRVGSCRSGRGHQKPKRPFVGRCGLLQSRRGFLWTMQSRSGLAKSRFGLTISQSRRAIGIILLPHSFLLSTISAPSRIRILVGSLYGAPRGTNENAPAPLSRLRPVVIERSLKACYKKLPYEKTTRVQEQLPITSYIRLYC